MGKQKRRKCDICGDSVIALARHIKSKHTKIKDYKCEYEECLWAFSNSGDLSRHITRIHKKKKPYKCMYENCEATFFQEHERENHVNSVHLDIRPFICSELVDGVPCGAAFHTDGKLRRHINDGHINIENTVPCPDCNRLFKSKDSYNKHIKYKHLKILRYTCGKDKCDYRCFDKSDMKKHKKICTGGEHGSYGEVMIKNVLKKLDINFQYDKSYKLMGNYGSLLRWDFIILTDDEPLFIEFDGEQHFSPQRYGGRSKAKSQEAFIKQQKNDKLKNDFCDNECYLLLRIPYTKVDDIEPLVKDFIATHTTGYLPCPCE